MFCKGMYYIRNPGYYGPLIMLQEINVAINCIVTT